MNWKRLLRPWKIIKDLEERIEFLQHNIKYNYVPLNCLVPSDYKIKFAGYEQVVYKPFAIVHITKSCSNWPAILSQNDQFVEMMKWEKQDYVAGDTVYVNLETSKK